MSDPIGMFQVPAGPPAGRSSVNPADVINSLTQSRYTPQQMDQAAREAATPIPGGHAQNVPLNLQPTQKDTSMPDRTRTGAVGAGNAKAQGIGNAISSVIQTVGKFEGEHQNKQRLQLATDTQTLLTAQSAMDQAQTILKNDPNNADAKAAVERNQKIQEGILADPKTRKQIAKGFSIDFTDPKKNDTPEHQGVAQGKEMAQAHASYAEQFNKGVPQAFTSNTQAQARYQNMQLEQKSQDNVTKAMIPFFSQALRNEGAMSRTEYKAHVDMQKAMVESEDKWARLQTHFKQQMTLQKEKFNNEAALVGMRARASVDSAFQIMQLKDANPTEVVAKAQKSMEDISKQEADIDTKISKLEIDKRTLMGADSKDKEGQVKSVTEQIEDLKKLKEATHESGTQIRGYWQARMKQTAGVDMVGGSNGPTGGSSDSTDTTGGFNNIHNWVNDTNQAFGGGSEDDDTDPD